MGGWVAAVAASVHLEQVEYGGVTVTMGLNPELLPRTLESLKLSVEKKKIHNI